MKKAYYNSKEIRKIDAQYNVVYGKRSNGKSYDGIYNGLCDFWNSGCVNQFAYIRRWDEDFQKNRGNSLFNSLVCNGYRKNVIKEITNGEYDDVYYYCRKWYLCRFDEELQKRITCDKPFAYAFSLSAMEHDKSTSYPNITTIILDEFISRDVYLDDEFIIFMNCISTIARDRDNVKIWMFGNSVDLYAPYFDEMGLTRVRQQQPGTIDVYTMGEKDGNHLTVAVEYCVDNENYTKSKENKIDLFCFDNNRLRMITDGVWEMDVWPHCPVKYKSTDIIFQYFIRFKDVVLHCEIIQHDDLLFTYVHKKTTPIKDNVNDLIYDTDYSPRPNYRRKINKPLSDIEKKIYYFYTADKVFYQDNLTGEIMRSYLNWCYN